jgi:hypothetical protein
MNKIIPIGQLAAVLGKEVDEVMRAVKISLFNGVIRDTRVDTGRLRGNWQTTTGGPSNSTVLREDKVQQFSNGGKAQDDVVRTVTPDGRDFLTNNLPYAEVWEQRDGMVAKNVARIERNIQEAVRAAN